MRVVAILIGLIIACAWAGYEIRGRNRGVSDVLFGFAALFAVLMAIAVFELE